MVKTLCHLAVKYTVAWAPIGHEAAAMVSIKDVKGPLIVWAHRFGQMSEKQKDILYD